MRIRAGDSKRLTWDSAFPAPFESIWAIFAKVTVLNNMTIEELTALIKRNDVEHWNARALDCSDSSWIDFERFADLLGVDAHRLKSGFWDQIGIKPIFKGRYEIRYCPKCWELGYHCPFFDLAALAACPWHRCPLSKSCASCAFTSTFSPPSSYGMLNSRFCARCGTSVPTFSHLISMEHINGDRAAMVIGYCREFIDWWALVGEKCPYRDVMLTEILRIGKAPSNHPDFSGWQIGRALAATGAGALAWRFRLQPVDVNYASWIDSPENKVVVDRRAPQRRQRIREDAGRCYRSLRKHLYKTYVQPHHLCQKDLINLDRDESLALDGDKVCVVSLAFLVWRMSIEGVCRVDGLRFHRRYNFSLRMMGPDEHDDLSLATRLRWSYFGFFAIWSKLDIFCGSSNFRVQIFGSQCEGHFNWKCAHLSQEEKETTNTSALRRFHVLYPEASLLIENASAVCANRRKHKGSMRDIKQMARDEEWRWTKNNSNLRDCLFQLRHPSSSSLARGQFWHVTV